MTRAVLLDTHPLSQVVHPRIKPNVINWLQSLQNQETALRVPEIADYELRRELLRSEKRKSIDRLNQISQPPRFIPLTSLTMVTTNIKHISRFKGEGIGVWDWEQALQDLS